MNIGGLNILKIYFLGMIIAHYRISCELFSWWFEV